MPRPNTQIDWGAVRSRALNGTPLRELARELGVPTGTILGHASREKWAISKVFGPGGSAKIPLATKNQVAAVARRTTDMLADSFASKRFRSRMAAAIIIERMLEHFQSLDAEALLSHARTIESVIRAGEKVFAWSSPDSRHSNPLSKSELFKLTPEQLSALAQREEEQLRLQDAKTANARLIEPLPIADVAGLPLDDSGSPAA